MKSPKVEEILCARLGPAHAGLFETLLHNRTVGGLHHPRSDGQMMTKRPRVVQPIAILLKVMQEFFGAFSLFEL
jgi:hypothetical protein